MNTLQLVRRLESISKDYYSLEDLKKITGLGTKPLQIRLNRLVKAQVLVKLTRGTYILPGRTAGAESAANNAVYPSYMSFQYALAKLGIISEVPYIMEFATVKSTRKRKVGSADVVYRKLKKELFFGYAIKNGLFVAEPEKAFLDTIYMKVYGKEAGFDPGKVDFKKLDKKKLIKYAGKFPPKVKTAVTKIMNMPSLT
jgi:predicted transcriptional regulator of viral defense system